MCWIAVEFLREPWVRGPGKCLEEIWADWIPHVLLVHVCDLLRASEQMCGALCALTESHTLQCSIYDPFIFFNEIIALEHILITVLL